MLNPKVDHQGVMAATAPGTPPFATTLRHERCPSEDSPIPMESFSSKRHLVTRWPDSKKVNNRTNHDQ